MTKCHDSYRPDLTEEMILNTSYILPGWRKFRVEYGFECSCPEGLIYIEDGPTLEGRLELIVDLLRE